MSFLHKNLHHYEKEIDVLRHWNLKNDDLPDLEESTLRKIAREAGRIHMQLGDEIGRDNFDTDWIKEAQAHQAILRGLQRRALRAADVIKTRMRFRHR